MLYSGCMQPETYEIITPIGIQKTLDYYHTKSGFIASNGVSLFILNDQKQPVFTMPIAEIRSVWSQLGSMYIYKGANKVAATVNFAAATPTDGLVNAAVPIAGAVNDSVKGFRGDTEILRWQEYLKNKGVKIRKRFSTKVYIIIVIILFIAVTISKLTGFTE